MSITQFSKEIFAKYPWRIFFIVVLLLIATVLEMTGLTLLIPVLGNFFKTSELSGGTSHKVMELLGLSSVSLPVLLAAFLALMAVRTVLMFLSIYTIATIGTRIEKEMKQSLLAALLDAKWEFHLGQNIGRLTNVIARESQSNSVSVRYLGRYLSSIVVAVILLVSSGAVAWEAFLLAISLVIPMSIIARQVNVLSRRVAVERVKANNLANSMIIETGGMMKILKASGDESRALGRFDNVVNTLARLQLKNAFYETTLSVLPEFFSAICAVLLIILGYYFLDRPIADIVLFSLLIYRAINSIGRLQSQRRALITYIPGYEACSELLQSALRAAEPVTKHQPAIEGFHDGIELEQVSFSYGESETSVLHEIKLHIKKGSYIGLMGQSGSGKTTIVDLITGLLVPTSGRVLIDGKDLREVDVRSWRQRIAYVSQDAILFNGTIRDNLLRDSIGSEGPSLEKACDQSHVAEFLSELPDGLETVVGDRGLRLSGGQRQRVSIARALMRNPDLLIFDEATSGLDSQSELLIRETLNKLKGEVTIVVIAHRFSAIRDVDEIFVLKDGIIVETGSYDELSKSKGEFYRALEDSKRLAGDQPAVELENSP